MGNVIIERNVVNTTEPDARFSSCPNSIENIVVIAAQGHASSISATIAVVPLPPIRYITRRHAAGIRKSLIPITSNRRLFLKEQPYCCPQ